MLIGVRVFFFKEGDSSTYLGKSNFFLNICEYNEEGKSIELSRHKMDILREKLYISDRYGLINNARSRDGTKYKTYYEITDTRDWQSSKTNGKLYRIGVSRLMLGGSVFISDTTEKYGWFVVLFPVITKPESRQNYPDSICQYLRIKSIHPKAQRICGSYKNLSLNPYHFIKDEEVE